MNLKKLERYLRVNLLGPSPRLMKKRIYRAAFSQSLRNTTPHVSNRVTIHHQEAVTVYAAVPPRSC